MRSAGKRFDTSNSSLRRYFWQTDSEKEREPARNEAVVADALGDLREMLLQTLEVLTSELSVDHEHEESNVGIDGKHHK